MLKYIVRETKIVLFHLLQKQTTSELPDSESSWIQKKTGTDRAVWMSMHEMWLQEKSWCTLISSYRSEQESIQARCPISIK